MTVMPGVMRTTSTPAARNTGHRRSANTAAANNAASDTRGTERPAHTILDGRAASARAVQHGDDRARRRRLGGTLNRAAGHQRAVAGYDVIDLGDLAVLDRTARLASIALGAMHHADAHVVL